MTSFPTAEKDKDRAGKCVSLIEQKYLIGTRIRSVKRETAIRSCKNEHDGGLRKGIKEDA